MICPICYKEIKEGSKFCEKCGSKIPRCPECGVVIHKKLKFCVYDGTPLPEEVLELLPESKEETVEVKEKPKKKRKAGKIILKILLIVICLLILAAVGMTGYIAMRGVPPYIAEYFHLNEDNTESDDATEENMDASETVESEVNLDEETVENEVVTEDKEQEIEEELETVVVETIHSYEVIAGDFSWQAAKVECENRGGYLATITSKEEYDEICAIADASGLTYLWLGALRYSDTDKWEDGSWITGEQWTFDYWYPGEPSMEDLDGTKEYYLCLWNAKYEGNSIGWTFNDQRNDLVNILPSVSGSVGYVCEYEHEGNII